ncbi:MAG: HlyD family efflux transporter periplasmic adaptor subunit [Pseudomonadota bacterium]
MSDLSFEVRAPLGLELATGEMVTIAHWSLQGFEFPGDSDVLPKEATLSIPFQGVDIRFPVRLDRNGPDRFLTFAGLTGRQRETLAVFYRSILSGKMASTEDVITSLDTPVDLVPMEETEEERSEGMAGKTPRSIRVVLSVLLYTSLAALIFWTLGSGIYSKISTVRIENARIEAPFIEHSAGQGGFVDDIAVAVGDHVSAGDVLVHITTPEGEAAIDSVRARIIALERRLDDAVEREARLAARLAEERAGLVQTLIDATPATEVYRRRLLEDFDSGWSPPRLDLFDAHATALREIDAIESELRLLRRERGQLGAALAALNVMAAEDGIVREISVLDGQFVGRNAVVATVEGTEARLARGWLDQSMAASVYLGMEVAATINSGQGREHLRGEVVDLQAGIDPELSSEFGMLVSVAFPDLSADDSRTTLPHLMPVELETQRGWAARLQARASDVLTGSGD